MSRSIVALVIVLFLATAMQSQLPPVTRDPAALAALKIAIHAMGEESAISRVRDCVAQGHLQASASWASTGDFTWKNSGTDFRYENPAASGTRVLVSGHGHPAALHDGSGILKLHGHTAWANVPPHLAASVLLRELLDASYTIISLAPGQVGNKSVIRVQTSLESSVISRAVTPQIWSLDSSSGLPLRLEYRLPDSANALNTSAAALEFGDYRSVDGVLTPFQIVTFVDGEREAKITLTSVVFNSGLNSTDFDSPSGGSR